MTLDIAVTGCGLRVVAPSSLPLERLVLDKPVADVIETLPRIFNLCKAAQTLALRMACDLPVTDGDLAVLRDEIERDHTVRLSLLWPARLGMKGGEIAPVLPNMRLGEACEAARLLAALRATFDTGEAVVAAQDETSVAARQAHEPLMREIEDEWGRGPLWRGAGRYLDLVKANHRDPLISKGWALVPTARGQYRVRAEVSDGKIVAFERQTPTDEMLRPGGVIAQSLDTLPRCKTGLAPLVLDILDPCVPLELQEADHA